MFIKEIHTHTNTHKKSVNKSKPTTTFTVQLNPCTPADAVLCSVFFSHKIMCHYALIFIVTTKWI